MKNRTVKLRRTNATRAMGWVGLVGLVIMETVHGTCTVRLSTGVDILIHRDALEVVR